jgi:hypothetical protein
MITIISLLTNETYYGDELEYFVDEDTQIGEVYLDGDLIYQHVDGPIIDESELELEFGRIFEVREDEDESWNDDFSNDTEDDFDY